MQILHLLEIRRRESESDSGEAGKCERMDTHNSEDEVSQNMSAYNTEYGGDKDMMANNIENGDDDVPASNTENRGDEDISANNIEIGEDEDKPSSNIENGAGLNINDLNNDEADPNMEIDNDEEQIACPPVPIISLHEEDLRCLDAKKDLNDIVIDSYLNYVHHKIAPPVFRDKIHMMSACFNSYLIAKFPKTNPDMKLMVKSVLNRSKNVDLFSKDFIFIPVNIKHHWVLVVICYLSHLAKNLGIKHSEKNEKNGAGAISQDHPYLRNPNTQHQILLFDSYIAPWSSELIQPFVERLLGFLKLACVCKYGVYPLKLNIKFTRILSPQQPNNYDSGLYTLQCVEHFFQVPLPFDNLVQDLRLWFPFSIIERKREEIRQVLSSRIIAPKSPSSSSSDDLILTE